MRLVGIIKAPKSSLVHTSWPYYFCVTNPMIVFHTKVKHTIQ